MRYLLRLFASAALVAGPVKVWADVNVPLVDAVSSISVEGEARRDVAPDLAIVVLGIVSDRPTAAQASEDNAKIATGLIAGARQAGLGSGDIQTSDVGLGAVMDQRDASKVRGFRATNRLTLRVHDLGKIGALIGRLAQQGANSIDGITFVVDDPEPVLDQLRADATVEARRRADLYAKAAGVKLGRVLRIVPEPASGNVGVPRAYKVQAEAPAPVVPLEAGTNTLVARVQVTWELVSLP